MKSRPILFSAPMVQAILEGRKTQTRRIVKPSYIKQDDFGRDLVPAFPEVACPYGQPGDQLWVREAWGVADRWLHECETDPPRTVAYRADLSARNFDPVYDVDTKYWGWDRMKWKPSIHMPRWASRITLEIVSVRVERLQDISERDAWAEGCEGFDDDVTGGCSGYGEYAKLWEQINGAGSWNANPWVWVVEFKRVEQ